MIQSISSVAMRLIDKTEIVIFIQWYNCSILFVAQFKSFEVASPKQTH